MTPFEAMIEEMKADAEACTAKMARWGLCDSVSPKYNPPFRPNETDLEFLRHIRAGRNTNAELREVMGITGKAVRCRIDKLREHKYISSAHSVGNRTRQVHKLTGRGISALGAKK